MLVCTCRQQQKGLLVLSWSLLSSPVPSVEGTLGGTLGTQPFRRRCVFSTEGLFCQSRRNVWLPCQVHSPDSSATFLDVKGQAQGQPRAAGTNGVSHRCMGCVGLCGSCLGGEAERRKVTLGSFLFSPLFCTCPVPSTRPRVLLLPPLLPVSAARTGAAELPSRAAGRSASPRPRRARSSRWHSSLS